ncbi:MAG: DMT family transporter [Candidatus Marinimicrobia bacterium]|nr:DMT family transporter [Candidatus Neomarinimicrobiota bacterium]
MIKYLQFLLLCLIWGTTFAAIKIGSDSTPPMLGLAIRYVVALLLLLPVIKLTGRKIPFDKSSVKLYLVVGVFSMGLSYLCTYWAMSYIPSSLSSILWATFPLFNGILAHFMVPAESLNIRRLTSIFLAIIGVVLILSDQQLVFNAEVLSGCLVVLLGVIMGSYPNVYIKTHGKNFDPLVLTAVSLLVGGIIHLTGALLLGQFAEMSWTFRNIGAAAYLGIFGSALAFFIYYSLLRKTEVVKVSFVTFLTPIVASLVGLIFLHETITLKEIGGILLIFSGLFMYDFMKYYRYISAYKTRPRMAS